MPIHFSQVCDLLEELEELETRETPVFEHIKSEQHVKIIRQWFKAPSRYFSNVDNEERVALLSTLFPERRTDRIYWMQEIRLKKFLARTLGLNSERLLMLERGNANSNYKDLASWTARLCEATDAGRPCSHTTVVDVERALVRYAAPRRLPDFSSDVPEVTLEKIIQKCSSREVKWLTRLLLKRHHPVQLNERVVLESFHLLLPWVLKFQSNFAAAARVLENLEQSGLLARSCGVFEKDGLQRLIGQHLRPEIGIKVGRPTWTKCRSIKHVLQKVRKDTWAIEPKLDGEYCQVHIDLSRGERCIQLFSKSGKDSTEDRKFVHSWLRRWLRLGHSDCRIKRKCILEGELLVQNRATKSVFEFSKLRKHVTRAGRYLGTEQDSPRSANEELVIIFYDALLIDDEVVMHLPYSLRRKHLNDILNSSSNDSFDFTATSQRVVIDFSKLSPEKATAKLEGVLLKAITSRCEGLVLKRCNSPYLPFGRGSHDHVIKLKKDYIPGLGDTADFAVIGASFDPAKATTARLKKLKWTSLTIACLKNKEQVARFEARPNFKVMDSIDPEGVSFEDLEHICNIGQYRVMVGQDFDTEQAFDLTMDEYDRRPDVVFSSPLVVEVLGADFDKPRSKNYYTLRFPRLQKIHYDRGEADVVCFDELQNMARQAKAPPNDLLEEEKRWRERIRQVGIPKRPLYKNQDSGFSQTTTESEPTESPLRATTGSLSATNSSRRQKDTLTNAADLIRIDSCERLPNETNVSIVTDLPPSGKMDQPLIPSTSVKPGIHRDLVDYSSTRTTKRSSKQCGFSAERPHFAKKLKTSTEERPNENAAPAGNLRNHHNTSPTHLMQSAEPLLEITNNVARSLRSKRNNTSVHQASAAGCGQSGSSNVERNSIIAISHASPPSKPPCSTARSQRSKALVTASPLFENYILCLAPCISANPYITETVVPRLCSGPILTTLTHWIRDVQDLDPAAPLVSESQAYPTLLKAVLVESRRPGPTKDVIERVRDVVKLVMGETVELWDWRIGEELPWEGGEGRNEAVSGRLGRWYLGCVTSDGSDARPMWRKADDGVRVGVVNRLLVSSVEDVAD